MFHICSYFLSLVLDFEPWGSPIPPDGDSKSPWGSLVTSGDGSNDSSDVSMMSFASSAAVGAKMSVKGEAAQLPEPLTGLVEDIPIPKRSRDPNSGLSDGESLSLSLDGVAPKKKKLSFGSEQHRRFQEVIAMQQNMRCNGINADFAT